MAVSEKGHLRISNISNEIEQIKHQSNDLYWVGLKFFSSLCCDFHTLDDASHHNIDCKKICDREIKS